MFKSLKTELFFLKKLIKGRYPLSYYFNYFKNKLFNGFFLSQLPEFKCDIDNNISIHILCQKKDVYMLEWCLRSFLYHSSLCPKIFIHDDGSFDDSLVSKLQSRMNNLRVVRKKEADKIIANYPGLTNKVKKFREEGHTMIMEFFDTYLLSRIWGAKNIIIMDSDLIFIRKPQEIIDFVKGKINCDVMVSRQLVPMI